MVRKRNPRLLPNVIQAIADLSENKGSSEHNIIQLVRNGVRLHHSRTMVDNNVRKALKNGVSSGILSYRRGRYRFSVTPVPWRNITGGGDLKNSFGHRGRRSRRRRRRRRQRRIWRSRHRRDSPYLSPDDDAPPNLVASTTRNLESDSDNDYNTRPMISNFRRRRRIRVLADRKTSRTYNVAEQNSDKEVKTLLEKVKSQESLKSESCVDALEHGSMTKMLEEEPEEDLEEKSIDKVIAESKVVTAEETQPDFNSIHKLDCDSGPKDSYLN